MSAEKLGLPPHLQGKQVAEHLWKPVIVEKELKNIDDESEVNDAEEKIADVFIAQGVDEGGIFDQAVLEEVAAVNEVLLKNVNANTLAEASTMMSSVFSSLGSMLSHGGAFCAHCVGAVGNVGGSLGSVAGAGGGLGGLGGGHFHADGTYHAQAHGPSSSPSHDHSPSFSPSISQPSQSIGRNTSDWQFWYNGSTVDVTKGLFQFGPENPVAVEKCIYELLLFEVA